MKPYDGTRLNVFGHAFVWLLMALAGTPAFAEPELTVLPQTGKARPGAPYRIVCEVSWEGDPAEYVIIPAEPSSIDWGTVSVSEARAFIRDGRNVVSQTVEIVPDQPGDYKTPEIRIAYFHPEATPPAETAAPGTVPSDPGVPPSLRADPSDIVVRPSRTLAWIFGGLGASLLLLPFGWWSAQRLRRPQPELHTAMAVDRTAAQEALHTARQRRLDGNFYEYYVALNRAAAPLDPDLAAALKARGEAVGYRGIRPTDTEMDTDLRAVERAMTRKKEDFEP